MHAALNAFASYSDVMEANCGGRQTISQRLAATTAGGLGEMLHL
jgi:hypothetical protein